MVHVSRLVVVCFPAKKKVLHSSTISLTVMSAAAAAVISPSKSFASPAAAASFSSLRQPTKLNKFPLISLSSFHLLLFFSVGRNLRFCQRK